MECTVETASGRVRGRVVDGVRVFRGLPFAAPPVGAARLRPPGPVAPWAGARDAFEPGPGAPQNPGMVSQLLGMDTGHTAEDCLYLDVWAPTPRPSRLPVMVWIHGGSFTIGSGSQPIYDGARLARRGDAVVVTLNYRLGLLGWLALPALAREPGNVLGNLGLLDQIAALRWVREHADAFGGDPERVTVFGESAGAMSIGALLAAPAARGLFRRAILQSGAAHNAAPVDAAERVGRRTMETLGLAPDDVAGLRAAPVSALLAAQARIRETRGLGFRGLAYQPTVDGTVLPEAPDAVLARGGVPGVDLLVGTNRDEWKLFGLGDPKARSLDEAGLLRRCRRVVPGGADPGRSHAERIVEGYRAARAGHAPTDPPELWFAIESDRYFRMPAIRMAEWQAGAGGAVWSYRFDWASPAMEGAVGACHALELPFVFGLVGDTVLRRFVGDGPRAAALSDRMQEAWLRFAHDGAPGARDLPDWPAYDPDRRATLLFDAECRTEDDPGSAERRLWDGLV